MHQNPSFQWTPINNWKNPEIRVRSTIEIGPYFWVCKTRTRLPRSHCRLCLNLWSQPWNCWTCFCDDRVRNEHKHTFIQCNITDSASVPPPDGCNSKGTANHDWLCQTTPQSTDYRRTKTNKEYKHGQTNLDANKPGKLQILNHRPLLATFQKPDLVPKAPNLLLSWCQVSYKPGLGPRYNSNMVL